MLIRETDAGRPWWDGSNIIQVIPVCTLTRIANAVESKWGEAALIIWYDFRQQTASTDV